MGSVKRVATIVGTRPEAIKLAPVVRALQPYHSELENVVVATGQHQELAIQPLSLFGIKPDVNLGVMREGQDLCGLSGRVTDAVNGWLKRSGADLVVVQGDTTSAFGASLAAFYHGVPVAHVEAGLRSFSLRDPWPEEGNRKMISALSELHFAPTLSAKEALLRENVPESKICVTGNSVVDALNSLARVPFNFEDSELPSIPFGKKRIILVTLHRRESWGKVLEDICLALTDLICALPDVVVVYPIHLNPNVQRTVKRVLSGYQKFFLLKPLDYLTFLNVMKYSDLILTDSGGVQEEAPSFGKPLLLLRERSERPEAFEFGSAKIVGKDRQKIVQEALKFLTNPPPLKKIRNPYGDGRAGGRIAKGIFRWSKGEQPFLSPEDEFEDLAWMSHRWTGTQLSLQL